MRFFRWKQLDHGVAINAVVGIPGNIDQSAKVILTYQNDRIRELTTICYNSELVENVTLR